MKRLFLIAVILMASGLPVSAQDDFKTYSAEGVTIQYPAEWFVCDADSYSVSFSNLNIEDCNPYETQVGQITVAVSYADSPDTGMTVDDESPEFVLPFEAGFFVMAYSFQLAMSGSESFDSLKIHTGALEPVNVAGQPGFSLRFDVVGFLYSAEWMVIGEESQQFDVVAVTTKGELDQYLDMVMKIADSIRYE